MPSAFRTAVISWLVKFPPLSWTMTFGVPYAEKMVSRASAVAAVSTLFSGMASGNLVAMFTRVKTYW